MSRTCMYCKILMPRGSYRKGMTAGKTEGYECRSMLACLNRIMAQRDAFRRVGSRMSNVFFNISQRAVELAPGDNHTFRQLREAWDAEIAKYRGVA